MGQAARRKQERREQEKAHQKRIQAARVQWVNKFVQFDAGQGRGIQRGQVMEVSDEGVMLVACLPGSGRVAGAALTLDMVDRLSVVKK